jgi:guanine nucleotide-binding protein subunit alpha
LPHNHRLNKKYPASTILGLVTVVNGVDISGIDNGGSTAEGFVSDPQIALLIHQL